MTAELFHRIVRAQAEYARCIDNGRLEDWPDFFDEDCTYRVTTADNVEEGCEAGIIYAQSRGMLVDRVTALRGANIYERHTYRHILGQPVILSEDGADVQSETSFLVARIMRDGTTDIFATGRYIDRYRLGDGGPKLAERLVVCDSPVIDTLVALPL